VISKIVPAGEECFSVSAPPCASATHRAMERPSPAPLPVPAAAIPVGALVVDIVANPPVTALLAAAAERGCRTLGGLPMLVRQGAEAFTLWTGRPAPVSVMMDAAHRAMGVAD